MNSSSLGGSRGKQREAVDGPLWLIPALTAALAGGALGPKALADEPGMAPRWLLDESSGQTVHGLRRIPRRARWNGAPTPVRMRAGRLEFPGAFRRRKARGRDQPPRRTRPQATLSDSPVPLRRTSLDIRGLRGGLTMEAPLLDLLL